MNKNKIKQELVICNKCGRALPLDDYYNSWDKPYHKRCSDCRREDNTERVRRYRAKSKLNRSKQQMNPTSLNLDVSPAVSALIKYIVSESGLCCANCYQSHPATIQLVNPDDGSGPQEAIQIYLTESNIDNWNRVIDTIPSYIPICLNCLAISKSGLFPLNILRYHYREQRLDYAREFPRKDEVELTT